MVSLWRFLVVAFLTASCVSLDKNIHCGRPLIPPTLNEARIIGGQDAVSGSWPWHVGIYRKLPLNFPPFDRGSYFCAGALIDHRTVLTAAHCLTSSADQLEVHLGTDLKDTKNTGETVSGIDYICAHPLFVEGQENDIGIVHLTDNITFSKSIRPICLSAVDSVITESDYIFVTGWGVTDFLEGLTAKKLKQTRQVVIPRNECLAVGNIKLDNVICTSHNYGSTCNGDSGGPLVYLERGKTTWGPWKLLGLVSGGPAFCGLKDKPMYFTEVPKYLGWLNSVLSTMHPFSRKELCKNHKA